MKRLDGHTWSGRDHWAKPLTSNMQKKILIPLQNKLTRTLARNLWRLTRRNVSYRIVRDTEL